MEAGQNGIGDVAGESTVPGTRAQHFDKENRPAGNQVDIPGRQTGRALAKRTHTCDQQSPGFASDSDEDMMPHHAGRRVLHASENIQHDAGGERVVEMREIVINVRKDVGPSTK